MLLPGAIYDPGAHWSYQAGYTSCLMDVWHYTVGRNSIALIRDRGLAAFLVRDEGIYQFAPSNARCFTQCEHNAVATATEVESLDGSISPAQLNHQRYLTMWKLATHGIPQVFYDGPRLPIGTGYRGVTNHRNLVHRVCDQHVDGFDQWVWEFVTSGAPPAPEKRKAKMFSFLVLEVFSNTIWLVNADTLQKVFIRSWDNFIAEVKYRELVNATGGSADATLHKTSDLIDGFPIWGNLWTEARDVDEFNDVGAGGGGGGGGGATPEQVTAIVTADGNQTRAEVAKKRPVTGTVG